MRVGLFTHYLFCYIDLRNRTVKWENIEPSQGVFEFGAADEIVRFAQSVGARVRGHNFMWYFLLSHDGLTG